ncbi:hypothetical protein GCM10010269_67150 [Streptomyces humidus]|uniref:Secreted protein n=1 Tax=Streptomyces humidus TaxID=52259 RepID=A0A918G4P2_9ACTN|nr:hypothetical protein [Streptomyces humidus]GGS18656.1 hypothetical protein GCM10010269_67150 [Streptomyces humidus]
MRVRLLLTGIALGSTMLVGGTAVAQAAPAPSEIGPTSTAEAAGYWHKDGVYSESTCYSLAASYAGPAYCTPYGSKWALYIWVE